MVGPPPPRRAQLAAGTRVLRDFVVDALVEVAPGWTVYRARSPARPAERYLVRVAQRPSPSPPDRLEAFARIAQLLPSLFDHRGLVRPVAAGVDHGAAVTVTPELAGESLRDRLARSPAGLAFAECARVVSEVAAALDYLHALRPPVVHR